ncbi:hypothetical protein [Helicobacter sp. 13S00477-4]|uniref:hypothetical protein n=1 Tax=Helicobacter sp. 13S00477-4 TaxID=1905759 RepID=UPI000BA6B5A7|nr:hypothetical protein [Helicobacter sp. 13S00477-4]PAF51985.1 hypothetical protein BKH44_04815 [Helicobacter sp. 13S00477-4]
MDATTSYITKYNLIQNAIKSSELYTEAIEAFKNGLVEFSFTPQEKANAYASFLAQTVLGLQAQSMDTALKIELTQLQADDLKNKSALEAQILKYQALSAAFQSDTSHYALEATKAQALQEKIKCDVLVKSANDNTAINKCNSLVELMNVMGNATSYPVIKPLIDDVNKSIYSIGKGGELNYNDELKSLEIEEEKYRLFIYTSKNILSVNENVIFGVVHNILNPDAIIWTIEEEEIKDTQNIQYSFDSIGYKNIKVLIKKQAKEFKESIIIKVE